METYYAGVKAREAWQVEKNVKMIIPRQGTKIHLENRINPDSNVFLFQKFYRLPNTFEVALLSDVTSRFPTNADLIEAAHDMAYHFDENHQAAVQNFESQFEKTFHLKKKNFPLAYQQFGHYALSNLMGGIGYFTGRNRIFAEREKEDRRPNVSLSESQIAHFAVGV